ncbi:L-ribulose-5-phosphate 4-epimerase [Candidatus Caldatribacterium sp.]|uniref:L-ribulose-5-phosphate 4-epimerase n=1 Tax=Candidatus Caldatribacterium sp. TaxID=2282143 RepID=UPI002993E0A0|nr:L-ribulose-5-phosphate 4-epimerase [Candidatus Calescibacterium sp.]
MLEELKQKVWEANLALYRQGLVILTWGNVSGIDRERGLVVIKPSGVPYDVLSWEHMVVVDLDGKVVEGTLNPSSDTPTHLELYRHFERIGGVAHTHSSWACVWAQAGYDIPCLGTTQADTFYGPVPCTRFLTREEIEGNYERATGLVIVEHFHNLDYEAIPGVLVAGHGPFTWGKDPEAAVHVSVVLEEVAKTTYFSLLLRPDLSGIPQALLEKHYLRKHGPGAYYGQRGKP